MIGEFLPGKANGFRHFHKETVGSTNTDLVELASQGEPGNLWLTAGEQLTGKGSRGRNWVSESGNLYASLLLIEPADTSTFHQLPFVAAVAARNALHKATNHAAAFQVKWPNDIMCNGKKCAGILLEAGQASKVPYVVIGMGINVSTFPQNTMHNATSMLNEKIDIHAHDLFPVLAEEMAKAIELWAKGSGFIKILNAWREHAFGLGDKVSVRLPDDVVHEGRFASIDDNGYMILDTSDGGSIKISTADIFFADANKKE